MEQLPDLKTLTEGEKDQLILEQAACIRALELKIQALEDRLSKDSHNSSKPPSSDGYNKPSPKSRRHKNKSSKKAGGQKGHKGKTLRQVSQPDHIEAHDPTDCHACSMSLLDQSREDHESRQVFELPPLEVEVTEQRAYKKRCGHCGTITKGRFPLHITQPTQYGAKLKGLMVYMNQYELLPFDRTREFFLDVFNQPMSVGTIIAATKQCSMNLAAAETHIKHELISGSLLHADETGLRVNKDLYWLHVNSTSRLTFYGVHKKRGKVAIDEMGVLPDFKGTLVHDHWVAYFNYGKHHSLCNAHHLRELTFVQERYNHQWARKLELLLLRIKRTVDRQALNSDPPLAAEYLRDYHQRYMNILRRGREECPQAMREGPKKAGRVKQTKARNLLDRLRQFSEPVLAFMYNQEVPFDNNQAERDVRMMKVQQKISGCFRTLSGVQRFCRIRGYISTAKKQREPVLLALQKAIENQPILFNA